MDHHQTGTVLFRILVHDVHKARLPGNTHIQDVSLVLNGLDVPQLGGVGAGEHRSNGSAYLPRSHNQVPHDSSAACSPRGTEPSSRRHRYAATGGTRAMVKPATVTVSPVESASVSVSPTIRSNPAGIAPMAVWPRVRRLRERASRSAVLVGDSLVMTRTPLLDPEERLGRRRCDGCGTIAELSDPEPNAPVLGFVGLPLVDEVSLAAHVHRGVQRTVAGDLPPARPVGLVLGGADLHFSPRGDVLQDHTDRDVVKPRWFLLGGDTHNGVDASCGAVVALVELQGNPFPAFESLGYSLLVAAVDRHFILRCVDVCGGLGECAVLDKSICLVARAGSGDEVPVAQDGSGDGCGWLHQPPTQLPNRVDLRIGDLIGGSGRQSDGVMTRVPAGLGGLSTEKPPAFHDVAVSTGHEGISDVSPATRRPGVEAPGAFPIGHTLRV